MTCPICSPTASTVFTSTECDCKAVIRAEVDAALSQLVIELRLLSSHRDDHTAAEALALLDEHRDRDGLTAQTYQSLYLRIRELQHTGAEGARPEWTDVCRGARRVLDALVWVWRLNKCRQDDRPPRLREVQLTVTFEMA